MKLGVRESHTHVRPDNLTALCLWRPITYSALITSRSRTMPV